MADHHLLGPFVRRFLLEEVVEDRNLTRNTQRSYRDAIRLIFGFIAERYATDPTRVTVEQVTATVVRAFLVYIEQERGNAVTTRNQRLAAIHSLFRFISRQVPELVEQATQIRVIPPRCAPTAVMQTCQPAHHPSHHGRASPARRRRHQHHPRVAGSRLPGDHQPLR